MGSRGDSQLRIVGGLLHLEVPAVDARRHYVLQSYSSGLQAQIHYFLEVAAAALTLLVLDGERITSLLRKLHGFAIENHTKK